MYGHTLVITDVALSPDDKQIVSASLDSTLRVWDFTTGSQIMELEGHRGGVTCVKWSPGGEKILSGSEDGSLKLWNAADGSIITTLTHSTNAVLSVAWNCDGTMIASGCSDKSIKRWHSVGAKRKKQKDSQYDASKNGDVDAVAALLGGAAGGCNQS